MNIRPPSSTVCHAIDAESFLCTSLLQQAILWRQWLLKKRTYVTTVVELLSPIVMISALVGCIAGIALTAEFIPCSN